MTPPSLSFSPLTLSYLLTGTFLLGIYVGGQIQSWRIRLYRRRLRYTPLPE